MIRKNLFRILPFLLLTILFVAGLISTLCIYGKGEQHLLLNAFHTPLLDCLMRVMSAVAEYGVYVLALVFLFRKAGYSAVLAAGSLLSTVVAQVVKHSVNALRPLSWFAQNMPEVELTLVEGVQVHSYLSFPSGHTTAAFALAMALVYVVETADRQKEKPQARAAWQCALFLLAALCGYSRIYLSQHFALDVLTGCLIGTLSSLFVCWLADRLGLTKQSWWQWRICFSKVQR